MSFKDDLDADLDDVFLDDEGGFAVFATVTGGDPVAGIFLNPYYEAGAGVSVGVSSSEPVFKIKATAATGFPAGTELQIEGADYVVVEPQPDGAGMVDLRLQLASV